MLKLGGIAIRIESPMEREFLLISTNRHLPPVLRAGRAFLVVDDSPVPEQFGHYVFIGKMPTSLPAGVAYTHLPEDYDYLSDGDIIKISGGRIRVLFREKSPSNSLLLTERCNNYCLMCSQPPKKGDDSWLLEDARSVIRLMPASTVALGITGGEPTVYGDGFVDLLRLTKSLLPRTAVHVLSNGRSFSDLRFAEACAAVAHPDLMFGIPVYSCDPATHDYVVQAKGAFDETIRGIFNLKRLRQKVEIRVVIHKQTIDGLPALAEYIARNLLFVDQVALMGLEMMGFARANIDELWIDPVDYRDILSDTVRILSNFGIKTSVYNHPLCLVNADVEKSYVKSISDWKNEFAVECDGCLRKHECGGFFSSGIKHKYSNSIKPFLNPV